MRTEAAAKGVSGADLDIWESIWNSCHSPNVYRKISDGVSRFYNIRELSALTILKKKTKPHETGDAQALKRIFSEVLNQYGYSFGTFIEKSEEDNATTYQAMRNIPEEVAEDMIMTFAGFCNYRTRFQSLLKIRQTVLRLDTPEFEDLFDLNAELRATLVGHRKFRIETAFEDTAEIRGR